MRPVLVVFVAQDHVASRAMRHLVNALAAHYKGRLRVVEVDVATHPDLVNTYGLVTVPALLLFAAGKSVGRLEGGRGVAKKVKGFLSRHLTHRP